MGLISCHQSKGMGFHHVPSASGWSAKGSRHDALLSHQALWIGLANTNHFEQPSLEWSQVSKAYSFKLGSPGKSSASDQIKYMCFFVGKIGGYGSCPSPTVFPPPFKYFSKKIGIIVLPPIGLEPDRGFREAQFPGLCVCVCFLEGPPVKFHMNWWERSPFF